MHKNYLFPDLFNLKWHQPHWSLVWSLFGLLSSLLQILLHAGHFIFLIVCFMTAYTLNTVFLGQLMNSSISVTRFQSETHNEVNSTLN